MTGTSDLRVQQSAGGDDDDTVAKRCKKKSVSVGLKYPLMESSRNHVVEL